MGWWKEQYKLLGKALKKKQDRQKYWWPIKELSKYYRCNTSRVTARQMYQNKTGYFETKFNFMSMDRATTVPEFSQRESMPEVLGLELSGVSHYSSVKQFVDHLPRQMEFLKSRHRNPRWNHPQNWYTEPADVGATKYLNHFSIAVPGSSDGQLDRCCSSIQLGANAGN